AITASRPARAGALFPPPGTLFPSAGTLFPSDGTRRVPRVRLSEETRRQPRAGRMPVTASRQGTPAGFRGSTNLTAGLLARGCFAAHRLPRAYNPSGALMSRSPLTVAGAAAES